MTTTIHLSPKDEKICKLLTRKAKGRVDGVIILLVHGITAGNKNYIYGLCALLGAPADLYEAAKTIVQIGNQ